MSDVPRFSALSLVSSMNYFNIEVESFKRDVHLLIFGTLHAAKSALEAEVKEDDARIRAVMETATGDFHERLIDDLGEVHWYFADQERFLLNMALVALERGDMAAATRANLRGSGLSSRNGSASTSGLRRSE
jgi:hypothetical protein